ncbi:MAG TPA: cytochrome P450 [Acidimicrobiales bacterium]|nr:cytochrome P450 [Acidimicrobiales bacterium]
MATPTGGGGTVGGGGGEGEMSLDVGSSLAGHERDPYPALAEHRRSAPVAWTRRYTGFDAVALYRYDDVAAALGDDDTWSAASAKLLYQEFMGEYVMVGMDEPEHRRYRALVAPAFRPRILEAWADGRIRPLVEELVDSLAGEDRVDLVRSFTARFPVWVIAGILGLPREDWLTFRRWSMAIIDGGADVPRARAASQELAAYFQVLIDQRRVRPGDDLLSELAVTELDGERLSDEEILSFVRLLLPAGVETTYRSSGTVLLALLSDPAQLAAVQGDPSLIPAAIEEGLRWETPVLLTTRIARHDTRLGEVEVPAGSWMVAHLGSANHDESRWDDPEHFDLFRPPRATMSFGHGPHTCLGMHLSRIEARVALELLLDRYPGIHLDPGDDDPHIRGTLFRSPTCVPVRLAA